MSIRLKLQKSAARRVLLEYIIQEHSLAADTKDSVTTRFLATAIADWTSNTRAALNISDEELSSSYPTPALAALVYLGELALRKVSSTEILGSDRFNNDLKDMEGRGFRIDGSGIKTRWRCRECRLSYGRSITGDGSMKMLMTSARRTVDNARLTRTICTRQVRRTI